MAGMTAYVNFQGRYEQMIAQSRVAGMTAGTAAGGGITAGMGAALKKFALPAAVAAAGVGAIKLGKTFQDAYNTIRVGTGATGTALKSLEKDFKAVAANTPASFADTSQAIADLNTRLGVTGKPLQDLSLQFIRLSRMTKTDLPTNIASVTRAFGDWEVATADQGDQLDYFFRAAQASGATVDELAQKVVQFGAPLRQVGFSLDEATAMFAVFEKAGVNVQTMMPGLRQALRSFLEDGRDPAEALTETFEGIQKGTISAADAMGIFGARAGADMVEAIRQGRFSIEDFTEALADNGETIEQAAKDTSSFSGKMGLLKNKVLVGLEPIATRVYDAINSGLGAIIPVAGTVAGAMGDIFTVLAGGEVSGGGPFSDDSPFIVGLRTARDLVGDFISWRLERLRDAIGWVADRVASVDWASIWDGAFGTVSTLIDNVVWAWASMQYALTEGSANLNGWVGRLQSAALTAQDAFNTVRATAEDLAERVRRIDWAEAWSTITEGVTDAVDAVRSFDWRGLFSDISDFMAPAVDAAIDLADAFRQLVVPVRDLVVAVGTALAPLLRTVWPIVRTLGIALAAVAYIMHKYFIFQMRAAAAVISWIADKILPALTWVITNVVTPVIAALVDYWLWAWTQIGAAATWLWGTILQPVFSLIWGYITTVLIPTWQFMFQVVSTVFQGIWMAIQFAWSVVQPIFSAIVGVVRDQLVTKFNEFMFVAGVVWGAVQTAVSAAWDFIRPKFQEIVDFVNGTLIPIWDGIAGAVSGAFDRVPAIIGAALRTAGNVVAGFLRGAADVARAVSLDEIADGLASAAITADNWGEGSVNYNNSGGNNWVNRPLGAAMGGYVPGPLSDMRDTVPAMLMPGEYVLTRKMAREAGIGNLEAWRRGSNGYAEGGLVGAGAAAAGSLFDKLRDIGSGALEKVWPEMGGAEGLVGMIPGTVNYLRSKVIDFIKGEADKKATSFEAPPGGWGAGADLAAQWIQTAMGITGVPDWWFGHLMHRARLESGFNPRAINLWDSNAAKGVPSKGLMQTIEPTFRAYAMSGMGDIWNPVHNTVAAIRYIQARYGSILNTNPNTGYAAGGLVTVHGKSFDAGGVLEPGWNLVKNMTGDKEPLHRGGGPSIVVEHMEVRSKVDADAFLQAASARVRMGAI
jgi:TP901 family phage tail tape measure protein